MNTVPALYGQARLLAASLQSWQLGSCNIPLLILRLSVLDGQDQDSFF